MKRLLSGFCALVLCGVVSVFAGVQRGDDSFAEYLQREREYYRAVTEYMRLLHSAPDHPRAPMWKTNMLASFAAGDRYEEALDWAARWIPEDASYPPDQSLPVLYPLRLALEQRRYDFPLMLRNRGVYMEDSSEASRLERAYVIALVDRGNITAVDSLLQRNPDWSPAFGEAVAAALNPPRKNPRTARVLSFFPGGGYYYTGRTGTGTASLFIFSLLGYAMYESVRNDHIALATAVGLFNFAWYTGSISVSTGLAEEWNDREKRRTMIRLHSFF